VNLPDDLCSLLSEDKHWQDCLYLMIKCHRRSTVLSMVWQTVAQTLWKCSDKNAFAFFIQNFSTAYRSFQEIRAPCIDVILESKLQFSISISCTWRLSKKIPTVKVDTYADANINIPSIGKGGCHTEINDDTISCNSL
jgi:hypothetical protein